MKIEETSSWFEILWWQVRRKETNIADVKDEEITKTKTGTGRK